MSGSKAFRGTFLRPKKTRKIPVYDSLVVEKRAQNKSDEAEMYAKLFSRSRQEARKIKRWKKMKSVGETKEWRRLFVGRNS